MPHDERYHHRLTRSKWIFDGPADGFIRKGARQLIEQALEAALDALLSQFANETTEEGHARVVRHGHLPEREAMTGVAPVAVKVPRVRDRG